jgi:hypothetical protein
MVKERPVRRAEETRGFGAAAQQYAVHYVAPCVVDNNLAIAIYGDYAWPTLLGIFFDRVRYYDGNGEYIELSRRWDTGDTVEISIPMKPLLVAANLMIEADWSKIAIVRGPLVYAVEQIDNKDFDINYLAIKPSEANLRERFEPELFGGVVVVEGDGYEIEPSRRRSRSVQALRTSKDKEESNIQSHTLSLME